MSSGIVIFSATASATTIRHGVISTSKKSTLEELPSIPEDSSIKEFPAVSEDGLRLYVLTLHRRQVGRYRKETVGGAGLRKFIRDNGLEVGNKIVLNKERGVSRLSNALLTDDCYILSFQK